MATTLAPPSIHIYTIYVVIVKGTDYMFGQGAPNERINGNKLQNLFPSLRFKWINWILGNTGEARMTRMARMTLLRNPNLNPSAANFYTAAAVGHWGKDLFHILNREQERAVKADGFWLYITQMKVLRYVTKILIQFETIPGRLRNYEESEENFFWENLSWKKRGDITWEN